MTTKKISAVASLLPLALFLIFNKINLALAASSDPWNNGIYTAGTESGLPANYVHYVILTVMKYLLGIFTVLAVISFIIYGIMFLMAGSDKNTAEKAKAGVSYSIIGITVCLAGYIIIILIDSLLKGTASQTLGY